ncbi:MAG: undecaprenyldiphospho-muramoylpentapeptide beta-N-acetylglucosaminyltransferase [Deltaproteobacteria bacterium]|nr:undecaprenyldiphospho-muramoylpentapeptide beta-N-acetylglucosaminyltransferase [Deltaproteobacteria bacterium]
MRVILAGGGTGGHIFPAVALAQGFRERERDCELLFIGGRKGLEEKVLPSYGFPLKLLDVEGMKGKGILGKAKACFKAGRAILQSIKITRGFRPDVVIGTGGYSSGPVVLAAKLLGQKTAILEPNAIPGFTNRFLGRFVDRIFASFDNAIGYIPEGKTVLAGNPVRKEILDSRFTVHGSRFTVLVFGGSQGARGINTAFLDALGYMDDLRDLVDIIHQTGRDDYEMIRHAYRENGFKAEVLKFIDDMGSAYRRASLVICRGGATSIAEITAIGVASILIPYPFAADNHQEVNARYLADQGATIMIKEKDLNGKALAELIRGFYKNQDELTGLREKAKALGRPGAADAIVEECYRLADKSSNVKAQMSKGTI